ncbi:17719_t:CDS:2 [Racocetra fulgida]|uniref:17719_t:CDS:1 n=1 Tax=Racocetra fulgida TaxID=60492 RepID=A0A9N9A504_9GLOM|nr:17719_t:CDS:2 [Racocetra fulgida]
MKECNKKLVAIKIWKRGIDRCDERLRRELYKTSDITFEEKSNKSINTDEMGIFNESGRLDKGFL